MMEVPYHYQFRIIVIGDTMTGKSSLLKTLSEGTFGEMEPTVGVDFFSKIIEIKPHHHHHHHHNHHLADRSHAAIKSNSSSSTTYNRRPSDSSGKIIKLQVWDTAGQERFLAITKTYYRGSVGIILVYDVTNKESYEHLTDWLREARRHVEPSPPPTTMSSVICNPPSSHHMNQTNYPLTSTPNTTPARPRRDFAKKVSSKSPVSTSSSINSRSLDISFNSISDRHQETNSDSFKAAYLVVGCKTDLEDQRQVSFEDGQAFANAYGFKFIETSSKAHYNVNAAFQLLAEEIYGKIIECGRSNKLHRTPSGGHLTFDENPSHMSEGIKLGPLIEGNSRFNSNVHRVRLLEAKPVSGYLGGCC